MRPQNMHNYSRFWESRISPKFIVGMNDMCWNLSFIFFGRTLNEKADAENTFECVLNSKYSEHFCCICMKIRVCPRMGCGSGIQPKQQRPISRPPVLHALSLGWLSLPSNPDQRLALTLRLLSWELIFFCFCCLFPSSIPFFSLILFFYIIIFSCHFILSFLPPFTS